MDQLVKPKLTITPEERAGRLHALNEARGSLRLEGLEPCAASEAIFQQYVDGEITITEMGDAISKLNGQ